MEMPENLKMFVQEVVDLEEYPEEVSKVLYKVAFDLYPEEKEKLLRYYYFGFLLTNDDSTYSASKIEISNTKIEQKTGKEGNPYWIKYQSLLEAFGLSDDGSNTVEVIVC